mgnify:CR=1 FL=1
MYENFSAGYDEKSGEDVLFCLIHVNGERRRLEILVITSNTFIDSITNGYRVLPLPIKR